ncbi:MAG: replicative DNA helicase [Chloroflexi bacterium]|nr:MAG: replicative DNA helicase [Phototrophicales bacterium]RMF81376.1 MAG: replicative DNA helicase [Chloroflexota bacterium]
MTDQFALFEQNIPYSEEAERAVLGAVLIDPPAFLNVAAFLQADDFYLLRHAYIWTALQRLNERGDTIDNVTLENELREMGSLNEIGGPAYITQLVNGTPSSVHAEFYGKIVERASLRRQLLATADEIKALALDEEKPIEKVTAEAETKIFSVTEQQSRRDFVPMRDAISEYFDQLERIVVNKEQAYGLPTGFRDIDALLGGLQKSDLIIFAGRPGMGKTSFVLSAALNAARLGARIAIFSMEMGVEQIVQRFVSMETGINTKALRTGELGQHEWTRFVQASNNLVNFRIYIDDSPAINPLQMRTKCRRLASEQGLDLIIVDYMQLMNAGGMYENNRVQEISFISRSMKELARELKVPLFSAAQLSRAVEQRQDKRPQLSDLRESGSIEQDADIVMFLYRDEVYNEATEFPNQADIIVAKHRNGPTGNIQLYFEKNITKFMDARATNIDLSNF